MNDAVEHYVAAREGLDLPGRGSQWLDALRSAGVRRFSESGFPTLKDEDWRYTNIRPILKKHFTPALARGKAAAGDNLPEHRLPGLETHRLVFVNGRFEPDLSDFFE